MKATVSTSEPLFVTLRAISGPTWLLIVICLCAPMSSAEDLPTANDAFERGEYVTALELYDTLAGQGTAEAQFQL